MSRYIVLKGRIRSELSNFYSVFILIIDRDMKIMEKLDCVASRIPSFYNSFPTKNWDELQRDLIQMFLDGKNIQNLSKSIVQGLEKVFLNEDVVYLIKLIDTEIEKFILIITESINRALINGDTKMEIIKYDMDNLVSVTDSISTVKASDIIEEEEQVGFDIPQEASLIPLKPALAPVSGKPIYEIVPGDMIYAYIDTTFERARDYMQYFGVIADDKIMPVKGEVIEVRIDINNSYIILVKLDDATYGELFEEEKIKIKTAPPENQPSFDSFKERDSSASKKKTSKKEKKSSPVVFILLGIVGAMILVLIILTVL